MKWGRDPEPPNARVERRRSAPSEGVPLAYPARLKPMIPDDTVQAMMRERMTASGMTKRGAGGVRSNDLLGGHVFLLVCYGL